ncbi:MAG: molybdenum cofactor biosynthesis protein MoaB [Thermoprotei archaeon]|nr:MAG: molybdenum cofactor biosynthesis protein MoaB [Thermoprotei archaeon]
MSGHGGEVPVVRLCLVVTSDAVARGEKEDRVTPIIRELAPRCGMEIEHRVVVGNDYRGIRAAVMDCVRRGCDLVLVTGGTGPSGRDVSVDAVLSLGGRRLPGFGELFRLLSYEEIGARAWLSRAEALVVMDSLVVVIPGSPGSARLAMEKLLCPVARHAIYEIRRR